MSVCFVRCQAVALGVSAFLLLLPAAAHAQRAATRAATRPAAAAGPVWALEDVSLPPQYPGGAYQFMADLFGSCQYPEEAQQLDIEGTVLVAFTIGADGQVRDVQTASRMGGGCPAEALRLVRAMPAWTPAQRQGQPVAVRIEDFEVPFPPPYWKAPARTEQATAQDKAFFAQLEAQRAAVQEVQPRFPGAHDAGAALGYFQQYLRFRRTELGGVTKGTVVLQFIVAKDGQVRDARITGAVCPACDEEVLRVARTMPRWVPGRRQGRPVALPVSLGIHYATYSAKGDGQPALPAGVLAAAEVAPSFSGGSDSLMSYLRRAYLPDPASKGSGSLMEFVVQPDGRLTDVRVLEGRSTHEDALNTALVQQMPRWQPGRQQGKPVAVRSGLRLPYRAGVSAAAVAQSSPSHQVTATQTVKGLEPGDLRGLEPGDSPRGSQPDQRITDKPYTYVEQMPVFPGGMQALQGYVYQNLRYPAEARKQGVEGRVFVSFIIQPDGGVGNVQVVKGIGAGCDEEAVRVVKSLPRWTPGKQNGRLVAVNHTLPVSFVIQPPTVGTASPPPSLPAKPPTIQRATYVGGMAALRRDVQGALRYPTVPATEQRQGTVYVTGTVPAGGGKLLDAKVQHGIGPALDAEALRVVGRLGSFTSYKEDGKSKPSNYLVPVVFELVEGRLMTADELQKRADDRVYTYVEQMPQLAGGGSGAVLQEYVARHLRLPEEVKSGKVEGRVFVEFVVSEDGELRNLKVLKGLSAATEAEALRVVGTMPFQPGKQNGQAVNVRYTLPVAFRSPNHVYEAQELSRRSEFAGGEAALRDFLVRTYQEPAIVKAEGLRGQVAVRFVVQADGRVANPTIATPLCRSCDEEALRLVKAMPAWVPGQVSGQNAASYQQVQVRFGGE